MMILKQMTYLALLCLATTTLNAQRYTLDDQIGIDGYVDLGADPSATFLPGSTRDDGTFSTTLPFAFTFFGVNYAMGTDIGLNTNGVIYFGVPFSDLSNETLPIGLTNDPQIFLLHDDMDGDNGTAARGVYSRVLGTAPNRRWIIEYNEYSYFADAITAQDLNFEVVLYEGTNVIEMLYENLVQSNDNTDNGGKGATTGLQGVGGRNAESVQYSFNTIIPNGTGVRYTPQPAGRVRNEDTGTTYETITAAIADLPDAETSTEADTETLLIAAGTYSEASVDFSGKRGRIKIVAESEIQVANPPANLSNVNEQRPVRQNSAEQPIPGDLSVEDKAEKAATLKATKELEQR